MRNLNKIEINLIIIFYFAFLLLCLNNAILFEIPINKFNISIIMLMLASIEAFYYIFNNHNIVKTFIFIIISYIVTGITYYKLYHLYFRQVSNIFHPHSCCCDFEFRGQRIYYFKVISEWIQFIGLFLLIYIIFKYLFFRFIYIKNFYLYKKEFHVFNLIIIFLFIFFSGFIGSITRANNIYYNDKLYLNKNYYRLYLHYSSQEEKYIINEYVERFYPTIDWDYKDVYSKPNNYYSKFLNYFINNTEEVKLMSLSPN